MGSPYEEPTGPRGTIRLVNDREREPAAAPSGAVPEDRTHGGEVLTAAPEPSEPQAPGPQVPEALSPEETVDAIDRFLDEVEHALGRLDDGTYGTCESCGATIDEARLADDPTVQVCAACGSSGD